MLLWAVAVSHDRFKSHKVGGAHFNFDPFAHVPDSHGGDQQGIHKRRLPLEFIH
jgi:hypothetical protein